MSEKSTPESNSTSKALPNEGFVRLNDFVGKGKVIPVSRSTWYAWAKTGRAIKPKSLGPRTSVYDVAEIRRFVTSVWEAKQ